MLFRIDFKSGKAGLPELVDQIRYAAACGALRRGEPLPSIRPLAEQLRLNRNTVAKAYTELESQGVIETIAGKGCFLKDNHSPFTKQARHKLLVEKIDDAWVDGASVAGGCGHFSRIGARKAGVFRARIRQKTSQKPGGRSS